jgi:hypothetical protein
MASKIKVDQIEGSTGSSITIPSGQTLTVTDGLAASTIASGTLADARIPNLNASKINAGTLADAQLPTVPVAKGGTGLTSLGTAGQVVSVNSGANALEFADASSGKVLGSAILHDSDTRATFSVGSTNLTGDYYYPNSSNAYMQGSYTKQSATSKIMIWGHANYKFSTNSHGAIVYETGSTTINNLQIDEHNYSRQYLSASFSTVFDGMSTGSKTFRFVPCTGDSRTHNGIRSMNAQSDAGMGDTPSHNGRCYMYLMEIEA